MSSPSPPPPPKVNPEDLYMTNLNPMNCSFGVINVEKDKEALKQVIRQHSKSNGTDVVILYAIRNPACPSCREHGLQLSQLASQDRRLSLLGTVKETGRADQEILAFYQNYFGRNPMFHDDEWRTFKALGSNRLTWKQVMLGFFRSQKRFETKNIPTSAKHASDNLLRGGIFVFDRDGNLQVVYINEVFKELDVNLLKTSVSEARRRLRSKEAKGGEPIVVRSSLSDIPSSLLPEETITSLDETEDVSTSMVSSSSMINFEKTDDSPNRRGALLEV